MKVANSYLNYTFGLKVKIPILPKDIRNTLLDIDNDCPKFLRSTYLTYKSMLLKFIKLICKLHIYKSNVKGNKIGKILVPRFDFFRFNYRQVQMLRKR